MVEILLVRHASTAWSGRRYCGRSDPPLSPTGRMEAAALAARLGSSLAPGPRLICSPLRRSLATAEAISAVAGLPIDLDERWKETDFGLAEGRTLKELEVIDAATAATVLAGASDIDWPGGETSASLAGRVAAAWSELVAAGAPAVVVTHAGPILHALALANERPADLSDLPGPATVTRVTLPVRRTFGSPVLPSRA